MRKYIEWGNKLSDFRKELGSTRGCDERTDSLSFAREAASRRVCVMI